MMGLGAFAALFPAKFGGDVLNGLWFIFIGWFLLTAARQSYAQAKMSVKENAGIEKIDKDIGNIAQALKKSQRDKPKGQL